MSDRTADIQTMTEQEDEAAEPSLRARIRAYPRPALYWLAGVAVLVALELGRIVDGVSAFINATTFVVGGFTAIPGWIGDNVAGTLGTVVGALASDLTAVLILFVGAVFLRGYLPWQYLPTIDRSRRVTIWVQRLVLTAALAVIAFIMAFTPVGPAVKTEVGFWISQLDTVSSLPTLTSREIIPNLGHRTPGGGWEGAFLGLSPRLAWGIRFTLVWVYAFSCLAWLWKGYNIFRTHYREADWTPRDDTIKRFRNHTWGMFGLCVVVGFLTLAMFAPAISPVPAEHNIYEPYNHEFSHLEDGEVTETLHGTANLQTRSNGQNTVGINSYDQYDRYAPLGTTPNGQDMLTHVAFGARTSLIIALSAVVLGGLIAVTMSLLTAYYKGMLDIVTIVVSDTIISIPVLVLVMLLLVIFKDANHPVAQPLDGGLLLSVILGIAYWPGMWRSIRGPSLQVAEEEWVDAAKSYGQSPRKIMSKHMAPYIASYIIIYASLLIGGIIITVAALSFLGLGITAPTPEWGRLISEGRPFIATSSWHVTTITGTLIALVVLAFNALGDALRDAIDPEADVGEGGAGAGGGG